MKLIFNVKKDVQTVFHFLTNTEKFVTVHPLIYKMHPLNEKTFSVYEKINFGFIPYKFIYKATISHDNNNKVEITADIKRMVKIKMLFTLHPTEQGTRIEEEISITTFLPVKKFMFNLLKEQHHILFKNIENHN